MLDDVRFTMRQLRKNPGFAAAAMVTLALGIGAAAAMFGLIERVLLTPPPYRDPGRLVLLSNARLDGQPYTDGVSTGQWIEWRGARAFEEVALYRWTFNFLVLPDGSQSLGGMAVTPNYFKTMGLTPILGRALLPSEAGRPKVPPTAIVLGYDLWQRRFGGDPDIIGKAVTISRMPAPLPVVGVMPPDVRFLPDAGAAAEPNYDVHARVDFWMAFIPDESNRNNRGINVVARLQPGVTASQAEAELRAFLPGQVTANPALRGLTAMAQPVIDVQNRDARGLLLPLFAAVALVFLVACVNVAGLFVARGVDRHREYAMRAALGASRARLFRQLVTESLVLAAGSAVAGAAVAAGLVRLLRSVGAGAIPRADTLATGWPVFAFGFGAAILAALIAGLLPALRAASPRHAAALKGTRTSTGRGERRMLAGIAAVQVTLTVALLAGALLLVRAARNIDRVRAGFETEHILAATVTNVTPNTSREFHTRVLERVATVPGVAGAAFAWGVPLTGNSWPVSLEVVGRAASEPFGGPQNVPLRAVTPDYFAVMGIPLAEGRIFKAEDGPDAAGVVVVNQTLARRWFAGTNTLGRQLQLGRRTFEIVGIVRDARTGGLGREPEPEVYVSFWQNGAFSKHLVVRAMGDPLALAARVRDEVRGVDPTAAVEKMTTMAEIRRDSVAPRTFAMRLLIAFAVLATVLAMVGIYGVLSLSVGSRANEIAVRKAVGAQSIDIARMVLGEGGRLVAAGAVAGVGLAVLLGRALRPYLYGVGAADPLSLAGAATVFGAVAFTACLFPALRAARTDLRSALHQD